MPYTPKTNWTPMDAPGPSDFNRIEQGIADATAAAEAAQAAADAAQETADTALSAINELDSEKAGKNQVNTWTQRQTFAAGVQDGDSNADVSLIYSVQHHVHTRTVVLTYDGSGRLQKVEEKDGAAVVKTTTLSYDASGRLSSVVETAGGITRTTTLNYDGNGNLISVTRA